MTAGPAENKGCPWPDADTDGVPDKDDKCPTLAGLLINSGCPDTDADGIFDDVDSCINSVGPIENKGCPWADTDNDGTFDKDDKCPNVEGPVENYGCPLIPQKVDLTVEEQEVINKVFTNLNFEIGKSVISESSFESLKLLNELLLKKPSFKLLIEGHTDNAGKAASNMKLSQTRADAVKQYFIDNGVDAVRVTAKGYGPTKPIADNNTAAGKAKNRRVEFTILE
jgi:outer membrane protein OmpA-like peptidoglycan-associated protein